MKRAIVFAALMAFLSAPIFSAHAAGITSSDPGGGIFISSVYCINYGVYSDKAVMINRQRNCNIGNIFASGYSATEHALYITDDAYNTGFYTHIYSSPTSLVTIGSTATSFYQLKAGEFAYLTRVLTGNIAAGATSAPFGTFEAGSTYEVVANQAGAATGVTCKAHAFSDYLGNMSVTNLVTNTCQLGASGAQLTITNNHGTNSIAFRVQWHRVGRL